MSSILEVLGNDSDLEIDEAEANQNSVAEDETVVKQDNKISVAPSKVAQRVKLSSGQLFEMVSGMVRSLEKSDKRDLAESLDTISFTVSIALKRLNEAIIRKELVYIDQFLLETGEVLRHNRDDNTEYECFLRCTDVIQQLMENVKRLVSGPDDTISLIDIRKLAPEQLEKMKQQNRLRRLQSKYRTEAKEDGNHVNKLEKSALDQFAEKMRRRESESKVWKHGKNLAENVASTSNLVLEQHSRIATQTTESVRRSALIAKPREKELSEEEDLEKPFLDAVKWISGGTSDVAEIAREQSMNTENNAHNSPRSRDTSGPSLDNHIMNIAVDHQTSLIELKNSSPADTSISSTFPKRRNHLPQNLPAHQSSPFILAAINKQRVTSSREVTFSPPPSKEELRREANMYRTLMASRKKKDVKLRKVGVPAEELMDIEDDKGVGLVDELVSSSSLCAAERASISPSNQSVNAVVEQQSSATTVEVAMTTNLSQSKDRSQQNQPLQLQKRPVPASLRYADKSFLKVRKINRSTKSGDRGSNQNYQRSSLKTSKSAEARQKHVSFHPNEVSSIRNSDGSTDSISPSTSASDRVRTENVSSIAMPCFVKITKSVSERHLVDEFRASCRRISVCHQGTVLKNWLVVDSSFDLLDETLFSEIRPNNFPHTVVTPAYFPPLLFENFETLMNETFEGFPRAGSVNIFFAISHDLALLQSDGHNPAHMFIQFITRFAMRSMSVYRRWWDSSVEKYEASSDRYQAPSESLKTDYVSFLEPPTIILINAPHDNNEKNERILRAFNAAIKCFVQEEAKNNETSSRFYDEVIKRKLRIELIDWREISNEARAKARGSKISALLRYLHITWGVIPHITIRR